MIIKINDTLTQNIQDIENINETSDLVKSMLLLAHPVGSYYWSSESTNPGELFGGTWTQIKDKFIIAVGDEHNVGVSYGSNIKNLSHNHTTGNHTLTIEEMPNHTHGIVLSASGSYVGGNRVVMDQWYWSENSQAVSNTILETGGSEAHNHGNTGSSLSSTFDITPACEAAYCWKRIS